MAHYSVSSVEDQDLMLITVAGAATGQEIIDIVCECFGPDMARNVLWDFRRADLSAVANAHIDHLVDLAKLTSRHREGGRSAYVHAIDVSYGVNRMFEMVAETRDYSIPTLVCRDMDEALTWLSESRVP